jgi:hypothetical protein
MAPATAEPRLRVLLIKHPLRHVASFIEKARRFDHMQQFVTLEGVLEHLAKVYDWAAQEPIDCELRYEDLVAGPQAALSPILARFGLAWDAAMDDWRSAVHHHIGGNAGPRSQINPAKRPTGGFLQRKYNRPDVFTDDSFAQVLTAEEIEEVIGHPITAALCERFGYAPRIVPSAEALAASMSEAAGRASLESARQRLALPFETDGGHGFRARLELLPQHAVLEAMRDFPGNHRRSPLRLYEDGVELGPAHTDHRLIRSEGAGRFSHWDVLYFSTADNSDPNANGRLYEVSF